MKLLAPNWQPSNLSFSPLPQRFFSNDTVSVAQKLLGKGLFVQSGQDVLLSEIVEVEAYLQDDPASHSFRGLTARNRPMFGPAGTCYVYLSYGINFCMNVVTAPRGQGEAVLLRAAIPLVGIKLFFKNRGIPFDNQPKSMKNLLSGPGKLTQGFGIDLNFNGRSYDRNDFKLVDLGKTLRSTEITCSPRIGISKGTELPLRFCVKDSLWLSRRG